MARYLILCCVAICAFSSGWLLKSYQDHNDLRPKFKIGQKVTVNIIESYADDGKDTDSNHWYREKKHYFSDGKAFIAGIEWWPTKNRQQFSYWIGSTNKEYKCFDGYGEDELTGLRP